MKRIAVIGSPGAGKSTVARKLGEMLGLEVFHLDRLYWKPGWKSTPRAEWVPLQDELVRRPAWIIDGNYGSTLEIRVAAADTVVFLDYPRLLCLWRALKRVVQYRHKSRPDMGEGCDERVDGEFLRFIWGFPDRERPGVMAILDRYRAGKRLVHLRSPREAEAWLAEVHAGRQRNHLSPGPGSVQCVIHRTVRCDCTDQPGRRRGGPQDRRAPDRDGG